MTLDHRLVQVTNPTPENSLVQGVTGMARSSRARRTGSIAPELYSLPPEDSTNAYPRPGTLIPK